MDLHVLSEVSEVTEEKLRSLSVHSETHTLDYCAEELGVSHSSLAPGSVSKQCIRNAELFITPLAYVVLSAQDSSLSFFSALQMLTHSFLFIC